MVRIVYILAALAAFGAPAKAQLWMPAQNHERMPAQPLSRPPEPDVVRREKSGTAFFVDDSGTLLTVRHAIDDCTRVLVTKEGRWVAARVFALSDRVDLGLIKVPKTLGLSATFPRTVTTAANEMVFVSAYDRLPQMLSHGGMLGNATISPSSGEGETGYIGIDSDATFGASGAPVLDSRGLVEGVISRRTGVNHVLAVGAAEAKAFLASNGIRFAEDDRPQMAGSSPRANRAASISARVTCLQN
ncbi:serine protease [Bradyrhizobium sp. STM 3562]|uniref:S1 family peptidase n=1 Tax=Bradyrhizobium sp. STM 3562 TaxID=578924 RepID=UPI003890CCD8